jgi:Flp pilus assembly CpaF family ATPase
MEHALKIGLDKLLAELASNPSFYRLVDEVVQHLIRNREVQQLIHEQSASLVGDLIQDVRIEAARADTVVDRAVFAFRRRFKRTRNA